MKDVEIRELFRNTEAYAGKEVMVYEPEPVITRAMAHFAWHENVGQEVHGYLYYTVTAAVFAPAARHVEGKSSRRVAALSCVERCRV